MPIRDDESPGPTKQAKPSDVFRRRVEEARRASGLSQKALADAMTEAGYPTSQPSLVRLEHGTRKVPLDEALALAALLRLPLTELLEPADDETLKVTTTLQLDGEPLRRWLAVGDPILAWPTQLQTRRDRLRVAEFFASLILQVLAAQADGDKPRERTANAHLRNAVARLQEETHHGE